MLTEILENPHFNQFAALLSLAMAPGWRMRHPEVASVRGRLERLARLVKSAEHPNIRQDVLTEWTMLLTDIVSADEQLHHGYSQGDIAWFIALLDEPGQAKVTLSMLFAVASSRRQWYTAEQVADITGEASVTWRKRAQSGEVVASKAGKTWIFSDLVLRARGIKMPPSIDIVDEQMPEPDDEL